VPQAETVTSDAERLQLLYEMSRRLSTFTDLDALLRYATRRARELLGGEGCAVLLLDRTRNELYFPVASQSEAHQASGARLAEIRFPADRGIAGWVLTHDEPVAVADTERDSRFFGGVDHATGMSTRRLLCAPLRTPAGNVGVLEVLNPTATGANELAFLEAIASDVAVAHETARLHQELRGELLGLRQLCRVTGLLLLVLGTVIAGGTVFALLARALPLRELPARPGMPLAALCVGLGVALIVVARDRTRRRAP
jgi:GAF domain-containing protein